MVEKLSGWLLGQLSIFTLKNLLKSDDKSLKKKINAFKFAEYLDKVFKKIKKDPDYEIVDYCPDDMWIINHFLYYKGIKIEDGIRSWFPDSEYWGGNIVVDWDYVKKNEEYISYWAESYTPLIDKHFDFTELMPDVLEAKLNIV